MDTRFFLKRAIEELEQTREELEYWKQKYEDLEQACRKLVGWVKKTYREETMKSD